MIVMLGYSEINIEVLDVGIETAESNDCKEMLRDNRDTNRVLTTMWGKARFSYKDRQKFINSFI